MFISIEKHTLQFIKPAKTSRGEYLEKPSYLLWIVSENFKVCGEASPLSDLSIDGKINLEEIVRPFENISFDFEQLKNLLDIWKPYPSLRFALYSALLKAQYQDRELLKSSTKSNPNIWTNNDFTAGKKGMKINGLVWMNRIESMYEEAIQKINAGFSCIKLKVGALDFDAECRLIEKLRNQFNAFQIEIRLDANGGFKNEEALLQLKELQRFEIHSIEQPIRAYQPELMQEICYKSPISIALDEELIGANVENATGILKTINPRYIILKPTLLGGFDVCNNWIKAAENQNIGWWSTSALEGNIGLADIAQWVSTFSPKMPQGLGTGSLFTKNFDAQTEVRGETIYFLQND